MSDTRCKDAKSAFQLRATVMQDNLVVCRLQHQPDTWFLPSKAGLHTGLWRHPGSCQPQVCLLVDHTHPFFARAGKQRTYSLMWIVLFLALLSPCPTHLHSIYSSTFTCLGHLLQEQGHSPGCPRLSFNDVASSDCHECCITRPYKDARNRLLWRDKTCPACT